MMRLIISAQSLPGANVRYDLEACFFFAMISFYFDYVNTIKSYINTTKSRVNMTPVQTSALHWETFLRQILEDYNKPGKFFVTLKLKHDRQVYLEQDNIVGVTGCISKHFLDKFVDEMVSGNNLASLNLMPTVACLHNMNMNSLSMTFNRWFRYMLYNRVSRGLVQTGITIRSVASETFDIGVNTWQGLRDAYVFGENCYDNLYLESWPTSDLAMLPSESSPLPGKQHILSRRQ